MESLSRVLLLITVRPGLHVSIPYSVETFAYCQLHVQYQQFIRYNNRFLVKLLPDLKAIALL